MNFLTESSQKRETTVLESGDSTKTKIILDDNEDNVKPLRLVLAKQAVHLSGYYVRAK